MSAKYWLIIAATFALVGVGLIIDSRYVLGIVSLLIAFAFAVRSLGTAMSESTWP